MKQELKIALSMSLSLYERESSLFCMKNLFGELVVRNNTTTTEKKI